MSPMHEFLYSAEIQEFRTITTLLKHTDVAKSTTSAERSGYLRFVHSNAAQSSDKVSCETLNHFANVLVRGVEVLAILPYSERNGSADIAVTVNSPEDDDLPSELVVSQNPRR